MIIEIFAPRQRVWSFIKIFRYMTWVMWLVILMDSIFSPSVYLKHLRYSRQNTWEVAAWWLIKEVNCLHQGESVELAGQLTNLASNSPKRWRLCFSFFFLDNMLIKVPYWPRLSRSASQSLVSRALGEKPAEVCELWRHKSEATATAISNRETQASVREWFWIFLLIYIWHV